MVGYGGVEVETAVVDDELGLDFCGCGRRRWSFSAGGLLLCSFVGYDRKEVKIQFVTTKLIDGRRNKLQF